MSSDTLRALEPERRRGEWRSDGYGKSHRWDAICGGGPAPSLGKKKCLLSPGTTARSRPATSSTAPSSQRLRHVARALRRLAAEARVVADAVDHDRLAAHEDGARDPRAGSEVASDELALALARLETA